MPLFSSAYFHGLKIQRVVEFIQAMGIVTSVMNIDKLQNDTTQMTFNKITGCSLQDWNIMFSFSSLFGTVIATTRIPTAQDTIEAVPF